jgi:mannose-1-phosphate guanylyltransferase/mannose-6-phosphate isomerase
LFPEQIPVPANPIHPIILSGGVGSRLWPLSRSLYPKQLLALAGERTMIQETAIRVSGPHFAAPVIICNQEHRFLIAEQMRAADIAPDAIVLEPVGRNTAPAAAIAALMLAERDPAALMMLLPADHVVLLRDAFENAAAIAAEAAEGGLLVLFGISPRAPETGFGYIECGKAMPSPHNCFHAAGFFEKPDLATAEAYLATGRHYWNSGMFLFRADTYLRELERLEPAMLAACRAALAKSRRDLDFVRLDETAFGRSPSRSIDYAVMEHTAHAAVVPVDLGWSDVGSWLSLWEIAEKDADGNVMRGDVIAHATRNSYLRSEGPLVAAVGLEDVAIVATVDALLVTTRSGSQNVKHIVEELQRRGRELHLSHRRVNRPWGSYDSLDSGPGFQVKRIIVKPGASLSLQKHAKRAEHWVVVSGVAKVTCDENIFTLNANESTFIPLGAKHRLENPGSEPLHLIEVQSGSYLGEDDIVRFEDAYGR